MKLVRRIFISLGIVFFAVCCGAMLLTHWSAFGWKALAIPTGSMRPNIPPGSLVLVHRVPDSSLNVGDVITYINPLRPGTTISHRIIKTYKIDGKVPAFVTKGDANKSADPSIVGGLVVGKVVWNIRDLGNLLLWTKTWTGIAVMVYLPSLFIVGEEIQRLNKFFKQSRPYQLYVESKKATGKWNKRWAVGFSSLLVLLFVAGVTGPSALALLKSNTVALVNNRLSVAASPSNQCTSTTSNNNNVNVTNINQQSGSSGNVLSSGNTNGGSAASGNVSNNNSTSTTITITNC